ncbi:MAG: chromate transporter, partial [Tagaea sp.]
MMRVPDSNAPAAFRQPSFREALGYWFKLGCLSFGGPAGQIAMMQTELVDRKAWIAQAPFLRGLSFATLLPGPEAQQLATYIGWRLHGTWGGVAAGALFVLPGAACMLLLS